VVGVWQRGAFAVNRQVYGSGSGGGDGGGSGGAGEEALCVALEGAVWYEADKLLLALRRVSAQVEVQAAWLREAEKELQVVLNDMVARRTAKELSAANELVDLIEESIHTARPCAALWLVSPDTHPVAPLTLWADYQPHLPWHLRDTVDTSLDAFLDANTAPKSAKKRHASILVAVGGFDDNVDGGSGRFGAGAGQGGIVGSFKHLGDKQALLKKVKNYKNVGEIEEFSEGSGGEGWEGTDGRSGELGRQMSTKWKEREGLVVDRFGGEVEGMIKFHKMQASLNARMARKREDRENQFIEMGMNGASAKLAAYNDLVLAEQ
ncbi:hypothetical protein B484DRAFT_405106, partial [Ochromonadaceae sp. CCMP2298]